jgi:hypothetical protein
MANIVDNLLGGILGSKKDGSSKKGKFFLELDESQDPKPNQAVAKVEAAVSEVVETVKPKVEAAVSEVVEAVKPKVETVVSEVVETVKPEAGKEKKSKRTSVKDKATKKQAEASQAIPAVDPQPAAPIPQPTQPAVSEIKTFAPNYLNVSFVTNSRRRPGPSLDTFKSMAKQVGPRR